MHTALFDDKLRPHIKEVLRRRVEKVILEIVSALLLELQKKGEFVNIELSADSQFPRTLKVFNMLIEENPMTGRDSKFNKMLSKLLKTYFHPADLIR